MDPSFKPSLAARGKLSLVLGNKQEQVMAGAILAYLIAHGDEWKEICWVEFAQYLRSLPENDQTPGANEAKSVFSWELMSGLKQLLRSKLISYREDDGWQEYFSITSKLMDLYIYIAPLPEETEPAV